MFEHDTPRLLTKCSVPPYDVLTCEKCPISSVYWAITTMTTIGYGDISAFTAQERAFACIVMMMGCCFFAWSTVCVCMCVYSCMHLRHTICILPFDEHLLARAHTFIHMLIRVL